MPPGKCNGTLPGAGKLNSGSFARHQRLYPTLLPSISCGMVVALGYFTLVCWMFRGKVDVSKTGYGH